MPSPDEGPVPGTGAFCYVVLCHDDAPAALRLARAVRRSSNGSRVLLRHDRPAGYLSAEDARAAGAELLRSDVRVRWGGWSLVEAMLEAARHAVDVLGAEHVVLVSGHDHPVRDLAAWEADVRTSGADALLDVDDDPDPARHRYRWRTWSAPTGTPSPARRVSRVLWQRGPARWQRLVLAYPTSRAGVWAVGVRARRDPVEALGLPYVKASQWMVLSRAAVEVVTGAGAARARRVFARCRIPDESYVQSVVSGDPQLRVLEGPTTFTVFPPGSASPRPLVADDVPAALASGAAFARKVDGSPASEAVVRALDAASQAPPPAG
ncbi:beta-1,6-N-acetylglucosaminyltransferase [Pseudokineococcus sp. 1T1Z-3]|uniref:beta-1,6-N-acetylglucosaminyltransferase n=1 Tax=Pseudokineococcus sp. 1T1Z-3 TaxID=3132745 RepID=UPI0030A6FB4D